MAEVSKLGFLNLEIVQNNALEQRKKHTKKFMCISSLIKRIPYKIVIIIIVCVYVCDASVWAHMLQRQVGSIDNSVESVVPYCL